MTSSSKILRYVATTRATDYHVSVEFGALYLDKKGEESTFAMTAEATLSRDLDSRTPRWRADCSMSSSRHDIDGMRARTRCLLMALKTAEQWQREYGGTDKALDIQNALEHDVTAWAFTLIPREDGE